MSRVTFEDSAMEEIRLVPADGYALHDLVHVDRRAHVREGARLLDAVLRKEGDAILQRVIPREIRIKREKDIQDRLRPRAV